MAEILEGLNPAQKQAITHKNGPLMIIAGAGTGKTTVITRRIAWLIAQKIAKPSEILALTFTDKAANEMEARVDVLVPYGFIDVTLTTFHAFGDRIIREHAIDLGLAPDYKVLSKAEQIIFFREHLFEFELEKYRSLGDPTKYIEALLNVISRAKDEDISPEEYLAWAKRKIGKKGGAGRSKEEKDEFEKQLEVAKAYQKYQELKAEKGFIDFGDQVTLTLNLLRQHPSALKKLRERFRFILVDEFQDTNYSQFEILKLLAGKEANLTVVGDDDQSIYKFRGAAISNILGFEKAFPRCRKIVLTQNYRSTQTILDTARRLIKHNDPERLEVKAKVDKRLISAVSGKEKKVEHFHFDRVSSEADWVAQKIREKYENEKLSYKDFAILVRANQDAEPIRQSLNLLGIPYQFSGGGGLYVMPEVRLAVSFLRVIGDPSDSLSLYNLALSPVYRIDPLDLQKINTFADRRNLTLHHVFAHLNEFEILADITTESQATVKKIMSDISHYLEFARERTTGEVLYEFLKKSGFLNSLTREQTDANENRLKNLAELFDKVRNFSEAAEEDRVAGFVKYLNLLKDAGDDPESAQPDIDSDAVNILTIHKAKGLEFTVVFMVSLVAEKFPVRSRKQPIELPDELVKEELPEGDFHLMEERRLFYVGMTRAKRELYLTSAVDYGGKRERKVSPFVLEALDLPRADISVLKKPAASQIELFASAEPIILADKKIKPDELLSLSFYRIDDYLTCPLKYKYVNILRVPLLPNHQIVYGNALHAAVGSYFMAKLNERKFTLKQLLKSLAQNWSSEGYISREHEEQRLATARQVLRRFYKDNQKSKRMVRFVEEPFSFTRDKVQIKGRFDLVQEEKSKIYIVDFKSSEVKEQKKADEKVKESLQLSLYALAWKEKNGKLPDLLELNFLETGLKGIVHKVEADLAKSWEAVMKAAGGIRAGDFHAVPSYQSCRYCPYNELCPASAI